MIHSKISEGTCAVSQQKRKSLGYKRKEQEYERSEFSMMNQRSKHAEDERSEFSWSKSTRHFDNTGTQ
jgi:hypothetical protein